MIQNPFCFFSCVDQWHDLQAYFLWYWFVPFRLQLCLPHGFFVHLGTRVAIGSSGHGFTTCTGTRLGSPSSESPSSDSFCLMDGGNLEVHSLGVAVVDTEIGFTVGEVNSSRLTFIVARSRRTGLTLRRRTACRAWTVCRGGVCLRRFIRTQGQPFLGTHLRLFMPSSLSS